MALSLELIDNILSLGSFNRFPMFWSSFYSFSCCSASYGVNPKFVCFFLKKACSNKIDASKEKKNILFFNSLILLHNKFVTTSFLQNEWNTLGCLINQGKGVVVTCLFESNQRKGWIRQVETIKTKRNMEAKETI